MFETIVVGISGHPQDAEALALARRLADPGAEIIVASIGILNTRRTGIGGDALDAKALARVEDIVDAFTDGKPGLEGVVTESDSVGAGLRDVAAGAHADLIVVSSSRRGTLGRIFAGDSVRDVLHQAPCPVAIAPVGYEPTSSRVTKIVVGHDGSPAAEAALKRAVYLKMREAATLEILEVVEPFSGGVASSSLARASGVTAEYGIATHNLERIKARYGIEGEIVAGTAAHELARAAQDADLLAIGLQERSLLSRMLVGSTVHALLREQSAPLLIAMAATPVGDVLEPLAAEQPAEGTPDVA